MLLLHLPIHFEDHQVHSSKSVCAMCPFLTVMDLIPSFQYFPSELCHTCRLKSNFVIFKLFSPDLFKEIIDFCDHGSVYVSRFLAILSWDEILQKKMADVLFSYVLFLDLGKRRKFWPTMQLIFSSLLFSPGTEFITILDLISHILKCFSLKAKKEREGFLELWFSKNGTWNLPVLQNKKGLGTF